jgi:hypothetical protein
VKPNCDPGWANSFRLVQGRTVEVRAVLTGRTGGLVEDTGEGADGQRVPVALDGQCATEVGARVTVTGHYFQTARQECKWR